MCGSATLTTVASQHDHELRGRDDEQRHAEVTAGVPGAGLTGCGNVVAIHAMPPAGRPPVVVRWK